MTDFIQTNRIILLPDSDLIINEADSGKIFIIPVSVTGNEYTLPELKNGLHFRFIYGDSVNNSFAEIKTHNLANVFFGSLINGPINGVELKDVFNDNSILFTGLDSKLGDFIDLYCDGTSWIIYGRSQTSEGII